MAIVRLRSKLACGSAVFSVRAKLKCAAPRIGAESPPESLLCIPLLTHYISDNMVRILIRNWYS